MITGNVARQIKLLDECVSIQDADDELPDEAMLREFM
jgi:hypothetical protein